MTNRHHHLCPSDRRRSDSGGGERGSVAAEVTLVTPVLIALLVFVAVVVHRGVDARLRLDDAAHQAARAASLARTPAAAATAAQQAAGAALDEAAVACRSMTVDTDTSRFAPGGTVTVAVSCTIDQGDGLLKVPDTRTLTATFTSPVDTWRATTSGEGDGP